jgi:hypothetical protein
VVDVLPDPKPAKRPKRRPMLSTPAAKEVRQRAHDGCEAAVPQVCRGHGSQAHHVLRRSQGGTNEPSNLLWVCLWCHEWIHRHPAEAKARGLLSGVRA